MKIGPINTGNSSSVAFIGSTGSIASDVFFWVSGSIGASGRANIRSKSVFAGDLKVSGSLFGRHTSLVDGSPFIVAGPNITINTSSAGQISITGSAGGGGGTGTSYFESIVAGTIFTTASLTQVQTLSASAGLIVTGSISGGASLALGINSFAVGNLTTGSAIGSFSQGLLSLASGMHSMAGGNATVASGEDSHSEGRETIASGRASHAEGYQTVAVGDYSHAEGVGTIASGTYQTIVGKYNKRNNATSLFVVGDGTGDADANRSDVLRVEPSYVQITGTLAVTNGISGSLTRLADGTSYLVAGSNVTISTGSNGQVVISSTASGGGGGDPAASYIVFSATSSLSNERVLTAGSGITLTDNIVNGTLTISATSGSLFYPSQNITNYAHTNYSLSTTVASSSWQTINELTVSIVTDGGAVLITSQFTAATNDTSTVAAFTITRDGTDISNASGGFQFIKSDNSTSGEPHTLSLSYIDPDVPRGTHTYAIAGKIVEGAGNATVGIKSTGTTTGSLCQIACVEMPSNASYVTGSSVTEYTTVGTWGGIPSLSGTFTSTSGQALLFANMCVKAAGLSVPSYSFFRDSTNLGQTTWGMIIPVGETSGSVRPASMTYLDVTTAGTYVYSVCGTYLGGYGPGLSSPSMGGLQSKSWFAVIDPKSLNGRQSTTTSTTSVNASFTEHSSLKHTVTSDGRPILVCATIDNNTTVASARAAYSLFRDGVNLGGNIDGMALASSFGANSHNTPVTIMYLDVPGRGTFSYGVGSYNITGSSQFSEVNEVASIYTYEFGPTAPSATGWIDNGNTLRTTSSVAIDSTGRRAADAGSDVYFYVSGSIGGSGTNLKKSVFGGDVRISGSMTAAGISGSLTRLVDGSSYIIAGDNVTVTSSSNGSITISATVTSSTGSISYLLPERNTVIDSNTLLYWRLDETSSPFYSSGSNALTMSIGGGSPTTDITGLFGKAVYFNGTNDHLKTSNTNVQPSGNSMTVSFWAYAYSYTTYGIIFTKPYRNDGTWSNPYISVHFALSNLNDGSWQPAVSISSTLYQPTITGAYKIPLNEWVLLAGTYDGTTVKWYINGNLASSTSIAGTIDYGTNGPWELGGATETPGAGFNGILDDVRVENVVRTQSYLRDMYMNGLGLYSNAVTGSSGGAPAGINTSVQFNDSGSFGGFNTLTFEKGTNTLKTVNLSGSLTQLSDGTSYLIAGSNVTISSASNGSITISATGGGSPTLNEYWVPDPQHWEDTGVDLEVSSVKYCIGGVWRVGNTLYMFGARTSGGVDTNKILSASYDSTGVIPTWSDTGMTMPAAMGGARIVLLGNTIYAFGDIVSSTSIYSAPLSTPTSWSSTGASIDIRRDSGGIAIASGTIMIVGGYNGGGLSSIGAASTSSPTSWSTYSSALPVGIWENGVATIGGNIMSIGGAIPSPSSYGIRGSVYSTQPDMRSYSTGIFGGGVGFATNPLLFDNGKTIFGVGLSNSRNIVTANVGSELQVDGWSVLANALPSNLQYTCGWIGGDGRAYVVNYLTCRIFRSGRRKVFVPSSYVAGVTSDYAPLLGYTSDGIPEVVSSHVRMGVPPWLTDRTATF